MGRKTLILLIRESEGGVVVREWGEVSVLWKKSCEKFGNTDMNVLVCF